jgi:hypothetical protein
VSQKNGLNSDYRHLPTTCTNAAMKALLDNKFAPITFNFGFVECDFDRFSRALIRGQVQRYTRFGIRTDRHSFDASLADALGKLEVLTSPADTCLLMETRSSWTAVFSNAFEPTSLLEPMSNVMGILECRGLEVVCIPDRSDRNAKQLFRPHGQFSFTVHHGQRSQPTTRIRQVAVIRRTKGWEFTAQGSVQGFEQPKNYERPDNAERLTAEMLEAYCAALNIQVFDPGFYGRECLLSRCKISELATPRMLLSNARARLYLE